jgi:hypothetical protein
MLAVSITSYVICCIGCLGSSAAVTQSYLDDLATELFGVSLGRGGEQMDYVVAAANVVVGENQSTASNPATLKIPCLNISIFGHELFALVTPCGHVKIGPNGQTFTTPFGTLHISGVDDINHAIGKIDNAFSHYTAYFVGGIVALYILKTIVFKKSRRKAVDRFKKVCAGELSLHADAHQSKEDKEKEEKERADPNSPKFVCPGNAYRALTVLHPGVVGFGEWIGYLMKAAVCFYMQLYLPVNILTSVLTKWNFNGAKSPLYFAYNMFTYVTGFAALASIVGIVSAKCIAHIEDGAEACQYLLSMKNPSQKQIEAELALQAAEEAGVEPAPEGNASKKTTKAPGGGNSKVDPLLDKADEAESGVEAAMSALTHPVIPDKWLNRVEFVMCLWSMIACCSSSFLVMVCMFMKVATFQGDIINIAIVAVSLYFIFDIDSKVMEGDPILKARYTRMVCKLTVKEPSPPNWVYRLAAFSIAIIKMIIPFGFAMLVLVSWKQTQQEAAVHGVPLGVPVVIGGDPFHQR